MAAKAGQLTQAERALSVDKSHIWLQCFRTCVRCDDLENSQTRYEFSDGSSVVLDSTTSFPIPVQVNTNTSTVKVS